MNTCDDEVIVEWSKHTWVLAPDHHFFSAPWTRKRYRQVYSGLPQLLWIRNSTMGTATTFCSYKENLHLYMQYWIFSKHKTVPNSYKKLPLCPPPLLKLFD